MTISRDLLRLKLAESLAAPVPGLTRRDIRLPGIRGEAFAVIGVRRCGKTTFLGQCRADRIQAGSPREAQLLVSLEDERLAGMTAANLAWLLDEHVRQFPGLRATRAPAGAAVTLYLDEVQIVSGWEGLVRRLMDGGGTEVFVSGSSARLLSREVGTSLRGRAM
jgi:predicted AAA+ superfamily ATPase